MQISANSSYVMTLTLILTLNPKSINFDIVLRTTIVRSFKSFQSEVFVLTYQHIVTKW